MRASRISLSLLGLAAAGLTAGCGADAADPATPSTALAKDAATTIAQTSPCAAPLPSADLAAPAGNLLEFGLPAVGVQIYTCTATASGPAWVFTAPEARLFDRHGRVAVTHFAGPTWQAKDGSQVVGAKVAGATPDPTAIPWLLLSAASHAGSGRMEEITYIQRLRTAGGLAPTSGCDGASVGAVARVPYTATYCFYEAE